MSPSVRPVVQINNTTSEPKESERSHGAHTNRVKVAVQSLEQSSSQIRFNKCCRGNTDP